MYWNNDTLKLQLDLHVCFRGKVSYFFGIVFNLAQARFFADQNFPELNPQ